MEKAQTGSSIVKENAIAAIAAIAESSSEYFKVYFNDSFSMIL